MHNRKENAIISIRGLQNTGASDEEEIELVTNGMYIYDDDQIVLSYKESQLTGLEGTETTFTIIPEMVTLTRIGTLNTQMIFQLGKKHNFLYDTPYGAITLGLNTHRMDCNLNEQGGKLEISYDLDMDSSPIGKNRFSLEIKTKHTNGKEAQ